MYAPISVAAAAVMPLLHPSLPTAAVHLQGVPVPVTGVACVSAGDMAGLYRITLRSTVKTADELIALGRQSGYRCMQLKNTVVFNWGPVAGPEGTIEVAGRKPVSIVEVVDCNDRTGGPEKHYFLIAKNR